MPTLMPHISAIEQWFYIYRKENNNKFRSFVPPSSGPRSIVSPIDDRRGLISQRLMKTFLIVKGKVLHQTSQQFCHCFITSYVNVFVFYCPPEPLDEHVVQRPPTTVHAHRHPRRQEPPRERLCRELHPLVGVEHLGTSRPQGLFQQLQAEPPVERVRQPPGDHIPTVPVDHRRQVHQSRW